ncbi:hypothetical protein BGP75_07030 [Motiliproteus sp. MSK22-1]|nr:hypothetical protein BGP75_07030 [Motiliproteus sp. MSK22-1]
MSKWDSETAEWYAEKYGEYATNRLGTAAVEFSPESTVVDIGCGTGSALRHAAKQVTNGVLIGIDPVPRMVEIAREKTATDVAADRIHFYQGAAESLPLEDASADFVLAFDSFDHWQDQHQGLKEVRRVLTPDGAFVIVKDGGLPCGSEAKSELFEALERAGFKVVKDKTMEGEGVELTLWVCKTTI